MLMNGHYRAETGEESGREGWWGGGVEWEGGREELGRVGTEGALVKKGFNLHLRFL